MLGVSIHILEMATAQIIAALVVASILEYSNRRR